MKIKVLTWFIKRSESKAQLIEDTICYSRYDIYFLMASDVMAERLRYQEVSSLTFFFSFYFPIDFPFFSLSLIFLFLLRIYPILALLVLYLKSRAFENRQVFSPFSWVNFSSFFRHLWVFSFLQVCIFGQILNACKTMVLAYTQK